MQTSTILQRAYKYAHDVVSGEIKANIWIIAVCKDFINLNEEKWTINDEELKKVERFLKYVKGSKDKFKGVPIALLDWQCFALANIYGVFYKDTDERRYKTLSIWLARKNGKSTLLSALCLYALCADTWQSAGGEVYCAATKREQAKIVWQQATESIRQSKELSSRLVCQRDQTLYPKKFGKLVPLSSDSKSLDGLNPTLSVCDEIAAHPNSSVWDVLISALGARKNPQIASISTAGLDPGNFGNELFDYAKKVASGLVEDLQFFPLVYTLDDGDDPLEDESCWIKANPSLGYTIGYEYLRDQLSQARVMASSRINFFVKHMNIFVRGDDYWLNAEKWNLCKAEYDIFTRDDIDSVYLGLDLSSTQDLTAVAAVIVTKSNEWFTFCKTYLPRDTINEYAAKGDKRFIDFVKQGYVTEIDGSVIDYRYIEADIISLCERLPVKEIAFDRWNATSLVNNLTEQGIAEMVAFNQSFGGMSGAIRELEAKYLAGKLKHDGNPVLTWCMSNVIAVNNDNGDVKFSKAKSSNKIDAAVALTMAVGRAALHHPDGDLAPTFFIL